MVGVVVGSHAMWFALQNNPTLVAAEEKKNPFLGVRFLEK